jgi:long-chain acyl-CoA synthetase
MGYLDEDGYLFLSDRAKDMIITGGTNVYPAEIEGVLMEHPSVHDVAVIGMPDPEWGELVMAVVQPAAGVTPSEALEQQLSDYAKQKLASYKRPRAWAFRDALPRTEAGKLYKREIRDELVGAMSGDEEDI